jgi:hypothetical protein
MTYAVNKLRFLKFPDREEWVNAFEYYKKTNKGWLQEEKLVIEAFKRYGGLSNENADLIFDSYVEEYERFMGPKKMRALLRMRYFVLRGDKWGHIARLRHRVEHGGSDSP